MKKITIKNKDGVVGWMAEMLDPTDWIAEGIAGNWWGLPERWVLHKDEPMAKAYDEADVLEEKTEEVQPDAVYAEVSPAVPAVVQKWVKLKAEYTIEIEDITAQYELEQVIAKRKAEYPTPEEFLNAYFDGGQTAVDALQAKRLEIKTKYPKP